jgi:hypothetical protein
MEVGRFFMRNPHPACSSGYQNNLFFWLLKSLIFEAECENWSNTSQKHFFN